MSAARSFDAELDAVNALADLSPSEALAPLRKALQHRNNLIVSRAAKIINRLNLTSLTDDLAAAFPRFMQDPAKSDPQCWAKNELAKTLATFEYQSPDLFLTGLRHHQYEPSFGGPSDSAGPLRGTCALALVQCRELSSTILIRHLIPLFRDTELPVRVNTARALEQIGSEPAALLLRLRAELGPVPPDNDSPELLAACIAGVLTLEGEAALPWVAAFLTHEDDLATEAAFILSTHRSLTALAHLQQAALTTRSHDLRDTLFAAIAATHMPEATKWLLHHIATGALGARAAATALCNADPADETLTQLRSLGFPCK